MCYHPLSVKCRNHHQYHLLLGMIPELHRLPIRIRISCPNTNSRSQRRWRIVVGVVSALSCEDYILFYHGFGWNFFFFHFNICSWYILAQMKSFLHTLCLPFLFSIVPGLNWQRVIRVQYHQIITFFFFFLLASAVHICWFQICAGPHSPFFKSFFGYLSDLHLRLQLTHNACLSVSQVTYHMCYPPPIAFSHPIILTSSPTLSLSLSLLLSQICMLYQLSFSRFF